MHAAHLLETASLAAPRTLLAPGCGKRIERGVDREAEDVVAAQVTQQIQHFRSAVVGVAAYQDAHVGPVPSDAADHVPEHARDLLARRALAGPQERYNRLAGVTLED